jgi:uncharacterized membrane protein YqaE (UPF0057 family)
VGVSGGLGQRSTSPGDIRASPRTWPNCALHLDILCVLIIPVFKVLTHRGMKGAMDLVNILGYVGEILWNDIPLLVTTYEIAPILDVEHHRPAKGVQRHCVAGWINGVQHAHAIISKHEEMMCRRGDQSVQGFGSFPIAAPYPYLRAKHAWRDAPRAAWVLASLPHSSLKMRHASRPVTTTC